MSAGDLPAFPPLLESTQSLAACGTSTNQVGIWHGHNQYLEVHLSG